ncbi:peptidoglycan-binding domain-containing protein [Streptomyces arenae]|uniref:peptidoglycan-binding domain-containing protein n=1 Tax=Streptomyces arenae TaxID=29301 RepID=UPI00265AE76E|nr:peptidoglycan-binding protein [Streptomyces arenae]MCG7203929.1 peptidoglycan-binding protein [Streptomyces arenae]
MTDTTEGRQCPECGAPRRPDGSPSCDCNQRASDALRDARTAEQAAAEDFDPLRIRPYIGLDDRDGLDGLGAAGAGGAAGGATGGAETVPVPVSPGEPTVPMRTVVPAADAGAAPYDDVPDVPDVPGMPAPEERPRRRSRRALLLSVAGAVVAVIAVAGFVSGLFAHLTPTRDGAGPENVRESVPDVTPGSPSATAPTSPTASATSASPSVSASPSASAEPSATPSAASPSATPSRSATPTRSAPVTGTSASAQPSTPPVLRPGDSGAEVTELQLRLKQVGLYSGDASGEYDSRTESGVRSYQVTRGVLTDESGVYGAATRAKLESETTKP